jgi:Arc/MetJ-type ribon-helix-helix transcriptional regulator
MAVTKRSISMPKDLFDAAKARLKRLRYAKLSHYVQFLIERDIEENRDHVRTSHHQNHADSASVLGALTESEVRQTQRKKPNAA